jgi:hypothetical protein
MCGLETTRTFRQGRSMMDYPPFEQAVGRFRDFLQSQGVSGDVAWVTPADAFVIPPRIFVRTPEPDLSFDRARRDYQRACDRRLGVEMGVLCWLDGRVYCFIYAPQDKDESGRRMMPDGLKLTVPMGRRQGRAVGKGWPWFFLRWLSRRWQDPMMDLFHQEPPRQPGNGEFRAVGRGRRHGFGQEDRTRAPNPGHTPACEVSPTFQEWNRN